MKEMVALGGENLECYLESQWFLVDNCIIFVNKNSLQTTFMMRMYILNILFFTTMLILCEGSLRIFLSIILAQPHLNYR